MNCTELKPFLSLLAAGELDEAQGVLEHLASCPSCRAELKKNEELHACLQETFQHCLQSPPGLSLTPRRFWGRGFPSMRWALAASLLLAVGLYLVMSGRRPAPIAQAPVAEGTRESNEGTTHVPANLPPKEKTSLPKEKTSLSSTASVTTEESALKARLKTIAELKPLYQKAGGVLAGKYVKEEKSTAPAGAEPMTQYVFEDCTHCKNRTPFNKTGRKYNTAHVTTADVTTASSHMAGANAATIQVHGVDPVLAEAEKGKRYIIFTSADSGKVLASLPETPERLAVLKDWARNGVYTRAERDKLHEKAGWVIAVGPGKENCAESFPCQHQWEFPVVKVLKGEKVPKKVSLRGSYRSHDDIPAPLKAASAKLVLFMEENGKADASILASIPWSEALEKELTKK